MGSNRFMVVSEEKGIIAMNPSYVEQKGKNLIIYYAAIKLDEAARKLRDE